LRARRYRSIVKFVEKEVRVNIRLERVLLTILLCFLYSIMGILMYILYYNSIPVMLISVLWLTTIIAYMIKLSILKTISLKQSYAYKRKILALEPWLTLSIIVIMVGFIMELIYVNITRGLSLTLTPIHLILYLLFSLLMIHIYASELTEKFTIPLVVDQFISLNLKYTSILSLGESVAIILSNIASSPLIESYTTMILGAYMALSYIAKGEKIILRLRGKDRERMIKLLKRRIRYLASKVSGLEMLKIKVKTIGTLAEVEVLFRNESVKSLFQIHALAWNLAKRIIRKVPYVIRVSFVVMSTSKVKRKIHGKHVKLSVDEKLRNKECILITKHTRSKRANVYA